MKRWLGLAGLVFVGVAGWRIGGALSSDALSMAVGILFGVLAGVPTALLVLASDRRPSRESSPRSRGAAIEPEGGWGMPQPGYFPPPQQPPVIVLAGSPQGYGQPTFSRVPNLAGWEMQERPARRFAVVGDQELIEDW